MLTNPVQNTQTAPPISGQQNLGSKDIFLKILIAQMQNQDPLKPQDAAQMSTQLAQFNMVEQQINTNKLLGDILSTSRSANSDMAAASSYLGHQVSAVADQITFDGSSPAQLAIDLKQDANNAKIQVIDTAGGVVRTLSNGFQPSGIHKLTWDGATDNGLMAKAGEYSIRIAATDITGQPVAASTRIIGQVKAVRPTPEGMFIVVGNTPVAMANIKEIQL